MGPKDDNKKRRYMFGALAFSVTGLGVYFGCEKLAVKIKSLTPDEIAEANREAWKQRRSLERIQARKNNVSVYGWDDARDAHCEIATAVCKETYRMMLSS